MTGGSRGIGAATARALADAGADVAISFATSADQADAVVTELEHKGVRAVSFKADQADSMQVKELVDAVVERFGRLDILINNAGVLAMASVDNPRNDLAALKRQHEINFGGVVAAIRAAVDVWPRMAASSPRLRRRHTRRLSCAGRLHGNQSGRDRLQQGRGTRPGCANITINVVQRGS